MSYADRDHPSGRTASRHRAYRSGPLAFHRTGMPLLRRAAEEDAVRDVGHRNHQHIRRPPEPRRSGCNRLPEISVRPRAVHDHLHADKLKVRKAPGLSIVKMATTLPAPEVSCVRPPRLVLESALKGTT